MKEQKDRYEIFLKVCETGSFSKAAEALNYTPVSYTHLWLTVWYRETECFWKCGSLIRLPRSFLLPFYGCICSCFTP